MRFVTTLRVKFYHVKGETGWFEMVLEASLGGQMVFPATRFSNRFSLITYSIPLLIYDRSPRHLLLLPNFTSFTMGFTDLLSGRWVLLIILDLRKADGLKVLNSWLTTRSYISGYASNFCFPLLNLPSQMMRIIWSVLMRRPKTPSNDYFQCVLRTSDQLGQTIKIYYRSHFDFH